MSYKLVIAEKPSVAQSIAKVIGADKREDGYLEGNGYIVGFARTGVVTETVERKGIGTSATRAATIEKLVRMNEIEGMITELVELIRSLKMQKCSCIRYWKKSEYVLAVCETLSVNS